MDRKTRGLSRSATRFLFWVSGTAGIAAGLFLLTLRLLGYLQPNEYTYFRIALETFGLSLAFPIGLTVAMWFSDSPAFELWELLLGAIIVFVILPLSLILSFFYVVLGE